MKKQPYPTPRWRHYLGRTLVATLLFPAPALFGDIQKATEENFKPKADAHGVHWDYTLAAPYQGAGLRVSYAFNTWFAYGVGGRTFYTIQSDASNSTRYVFSIMPVSQFIFRYPEIIHNLWRPYFVSELNYLYQFSAGRDTAALAGKSGVEFFASQNFAIALEAGIALPFYRNAAAVMPTGGVISVIGAWYF